MANARRARVVCLPSTDLAFRAAIEAAADAVRSGDRSILERRLRGLYPEVRVVERELSGELDRTWYAYRDGRYRSVPDPSWHTEPGVAWAAIDMDGHITAANAALTSLVGADSLVVGRPLTDFMLPENRDLQGRQFAAVLAGEVLHSVGRGCRPDGSTFFVEYVGRRVGDEIHGWYRPAVLVELHP
jgi:PAS domain S-box-containing protein